MSRRERKNGFAQAHQVLRLTGKGPFAIRQTAVIQGPNPDRIARGNQFSLRSIPKNQRKLCVQRLEHFHAVLMVQREQDFTVRLALQLIFAQQPVPERTKTVQLAVADNHILLKVKGLHAALVQAHDRQAVKSQISAGNLLEPAHVRSARERAVKARHEGIPINGFAGYAENGTHKWHLRIGSAFALIFQDEGRLSVVPPDLLLSRTLSSPRGCNGPFPASLTGRSAGVLFGLGRVLPPVCPAAFPSSSAL